MIKQVITTFINDLLVIIPAGIIAVCLLVAILDNTSQKFHDWIREE